MGRFDRAKGHLTKTGLAKQDLIALFGFVAAALAFYGPVLFGGLTLLPLDNLWTMPPWSGPSGAVPHNLLISDLLLQNYPWKLILDQALSQRELPLWNPYSMAGLPYLGTGQTGALYPFTLLFLALGPLHAYGWYSALHQVLAASLTYLFLRRVGAGRFGATVGGFVFAFSLFLTVSYIWPMVLGAAVWLPLALWSLTGLAEGIERGKLARILTVELPVGAAAIALSVLGGHLEITFYGIFAVALYGVYLAVLLLRRRAAGVGLRFGLIAALAVSLGVLLAGAQWVPFLEVLQSNNRQGETTYAQVISYALPKTQVFGLLMPDFFGNPTAHEYFDLTTLRWTPVGANALGQPTDPPHTIFWGKKNYVEAGGYVGVVPLLLALVGAVYARSRARWFFVGLAALSLLLAFGTPLYALIYYGLPFFSQLRTPFRWLYLFDFSAAILAGLGADYLLRGSDAARATRSLGALARRSAVGWLPALAGLAGLGALLASFVLRPRSIALADQVLARREDLQRAFGSGAMLYSYEFQNLAILFGLLTVGGGLIALSSISNPRRDRPAGTNSEPETAHSIPPHPPAPSARSSSRAPRFSSWFAASSRFLIGLALLLLIGADLFHFGTRFASKEPASILAQRQTLSLPERPSLAGARYASFGDPVVLPANLGVLLGMPSVGGYDTIIARDYRRLWSLVEPPVDLPYNQIGRLHQEASLDSPILDLLGVRYILTEAGLDSPAVRLISQNGSVRVYERPTALPRAFIVGQARGVADLDGAFEVMADRGFRPEREVILVGEPPSGGGSGSATIERYLFGRVTVSARTDGSAWLILTDANAPGWAATVDGQETPVQTADGYFRAVYLSTAGDHQIVFRYSPLSVRIGAYLSFLALVVLGLVASWPFWRRFLGHYAGQTERVLRNTTLPMFTSFLNKAVDFGFAALMLRILGPVAAGEYSVAIALMGYFEIFTNFGLNALIIREVAKNKSVAGRYLADAITLRLVLCVVSVPIAAGVVIYGQELLGLTESATTAFILLTLGLIPGNLNAALSALFNAYERNDVPAVVAVGTNLIRIALSTAALLLGTGIIGLAAVSLFLNVLLVAIFLVAARTLRRDRPAESGEAAAPRLDRLRLARPVLADLRKMVIESYPLLLNHVLVTIFFKIDFLLLGALQGFAAVGYYTTAYKWLDGFLIIPSTFTFAVFPALSRLAEGKGEGFRAAYGTSVRILLCLAIPLAVVVSFLSGDLILLLAGEAYYPQSAVALTILIWFLPFSYINGLTQYALIAVNRQRFITIAFVVSATFNLVTNLIFIPRYSFYAASATTVLSEVILLVPFLIAIRQSIGWPNWTRTVGKPALAGLLMVLVASTGRFTEPHLAVLLSIGAYLIAVRAFGVFTPDELAILGRLTGRWRGRAQVSVATVSME